jgi:SAM-dependent methyltransferase
MTASQTPQDLGDQARAELSALIDRQMSPLGLAAMEALDPAPGQTVLDVGCGGGETVLQLAHRVGPEGRVIGVDIAPRVLAVARARTSHLAQIALVQADAALLTLPAESIDGIFSRFGTMFFADPVAAFSNLRRLLKCGGKIGFVCWRSMRENEIDFLPVAASGLSEKGDSASFSFADADTIGQVLRSAGFDHIRINPHDDQISCGDAEATLSVVTRVGALGMILRENPALKSNVLGPVRSALSNRERDGEVKLGAATWIVTATAP